MEPIQPLSKDDQLRFDFFCLIEKQEKNYNKRSLGYLFFKNSSVIQTTDYLVENAGPNRTFPSQTIIDAGSTGKFSAIFFCIWISVVLTAAVSHYFNTPKSISFVSILILVAGVLLLLVKRFPKNKNQTIELTKQGITIEGKFYCWPTILETYIVRRPAKNMDEFFLLLGLNSGELLRFDLNRFNELFSRKTDTLIRAIEFYKHDGLVY